MKQHINLQHSRINGRTLESQNHRNDLAKQLILRRSQGEIGKLLAQRTLNNEKSKDNVLFDERKKDKLINLIKYYFSFIPNLQNLNHQEIALELIECNNGKFLINHIEEFQGLDYQKIALKLIERNQGEVFAYNIKKFQGLDHQDMASKFMEANQWGALAKNLYNFEGLDRDVLLTKLIEAGRIKDIAENLGSFYGLDKKIAFDIIKIGMDSYIDKQIMHFKESDREEILLKLLEQKVEQEEGVSHDFLVILNKFHLLNKKIALKLIEINQAYFIQAECTSGTYWGIHGHLYLEGIQFDGLDKEVALKLIESGHSDIVLTQKQNFNGLDNDIALRLVELGQGSYIFKKKPFSGQFNKKIALCLIEKNKAEDLAEHLYLFRGLDKKVALKLIELGYEKQVLQYISLFK